MAVEVAMVQLRAVSNRRSGLCFVYSRDASEAEHLGMHVPGGSKWAGGFGHQKELELESRGSGPSAYQEPGLRFVKGGCTYSSAVYFAAP